MPRLYFHLHECGDVTEDEDGRDVHDLDQAHADALDAAREVMCAEIKEGRLCLSCRIDIADASGTVLRSLDFRDAIVISGL